MKKLSFLMLSFLSLSGLTATAQVTIPEITEDGSTPTYYVLRNYRSGNFLKANGAETGLSHENQLSNATLWYFTGTNNEGVISGKIGNFTMKDTETPYLASKASFTNEGVTWYTQANKFPTDGAKGVVISLNEDMSANCLDASNTNTSIGYWQPSGSDWQGTTWIVETIDETYTATKEEAENLLSNSQYIGSYGVQTAEAFSALQTVYEANDDANNNESYISQTNNLKQAIETFNQSAKKTIETGYYRFICKNTNYNTYFGVNSFGAFPNEASNLIVREQDKENPTLASIWYLESTNDAKTQFTFRNAATGEYLNNTCTDYNGDQAFTTSKTPTTITITYNWLESEHGLGHVAIKGNNNTTLFLNKNYPTNYGGGVGSVWTPIAIDETELNQYITENQVNLLEGWYNKECTTDPVLFGYSNYNVSMADAEKANVLTNKNYASYKAFMEAVEASRMTTKEDAFYYIVSTYNAFTDGKKRALYLDASGDLKWKICENDDASMLWKITSFTDDKNPKGFNISNANSTKNIQGAGYGGKFSLIDDQYSWSIEASPAGNASGVQGSNFNIIHYVANDKQTMALQATAIAQPTMEETGNTITSYNSTGGDRATHWQIIEAQNVTVKTSETSEGNWGSAFLPVSVQLPEGTTAYYVTELNENSAFLKEIEDGIVPAKTGVLINSENAGYVELSIVNTENTIEDNMLTGTLVQTEIPENSYALGNKESGLGFYKINPESRSVAGNKAYLQPNSTFGVAAYIFNFNAPSTNIEETIVENKTQEEYYDLQGRRVANPTKGIYVTKSGKKVIFTK